jgi:hypothetical protein
MVLPPLTDPGTGWFRMIFTANGWGWKGVLSVAIAAISSVPTAKETLNAPWFEPTLDDP